jgi:lysophospholipase L1-like esterase
MAARLDRDVLSFRPDLVILEVCLNDCLGSPTDDPSDFARQVGELIDRILASGAELILLTPNAMCTRLHPNVPSGDEWHRLFIRAVQTMNSGKMTAFVNAARAEAAARNVPIADAYARWEQMHACGVDTTSLLANNINHPTPAMHDLFVETIMQTVFASNC